MTAPVIGDTFGSGGNQFEIDFTEIGDAGNAADDTGYGSVGYPFRIATYEVSQRMIDSYNASSGGPVITMLDYENTGFSPPLDSIEGGNRPDRVVVGVSWNEAARFVNWLNTSTGHSAAYKFATNGGDDNIALWVDGDLGYDPSNPFRNSSARYFLPSEDEWYKAAYFGDGGGYSDYATGGDVAPTAVSEGTAQGTAVYLFGYTVGPADVTDAGGLSASGTMGQNGNAYEWVESAFDGTNNVPGEARACRGGDWWTGSAVGLQSADRLSIVPSPGPQVLAGFRVASVDVPAVGNELVSGCRHDGDLLTVGDIDTWNIQVEAGTTVRLHATVVSGTDFEPCLRLLGPGGSLLASNSGAVSTDVVHQATVTGSYALEILDASNIPDGTGAYQIYAALSKGTFETPASDEGGPLGNGEFHDGSITLGDIDLYSCEASPGQTLRIHVSETSDNGFEPAVLLYGPDGGLVTLNAGSVSADISHTITVAGTYTVMIHDFNTDVTGSGDYRLYFAQLGTSFTTSLGDEGGMLTSGSVYEGTIERGDIDLYSFEASAGGEIRIHISETSDNSFLPGVLFYGPDGALLARNDGSSSADIAYTTDVVGTCTVVVQDFSVDVGGSGDYRLYFCQTGSPFTIPPGDEGGLDLVNGTYAGTITRGDLDLYAFSAEAGDLIDVTLADTSASAFRPKVSLHGPEGEFVTSNSDEENAQITATASVSGTYQLVVQDANADVSGSGSYNLTFALTAGGASTPAGPSQGTLSSGERITSSIEVAGELDKWECTAAAGETICVQAGRLTLGNFSLEVEVFGPGGRRVAFDTGSSTLCQFVAEQGGTYTVVIGQPDGLHTGDYVLRFFGSASAYDIPAGEEGGPLASGGTSPGSLGIGDLDVYDFTATAGEAVTLQLGRITLGDFGLTLLVFGPDGRLLASHSGDNADCRFTAPSTGVYRVVVRERNVFNTGDYNLNLALTSFPYTIPVGDEGGALANAAGAPGFLSEGDIDLWDVDLVAGEAVTIRAARITPGGFSLGLRVYGPDGQLLVEMDGTHPGTRLVAPVSGKFLIQVRNPGGAYTGDYRLSIARPTQPFVVTQGNDGGGLEEGDSLTATLDPGEFDVWKFRADENGTVTLDLERATGEDFALLAELYDMDGELVGRMIGSFPTISFRGASGDSYTLLVQEHGGDNIGTYNLTASGVVTLPARIVLTHSDGVLRLAWPSPSRGWLLEQSSSLEPESWSPSSTPFADDGIQRAVEISLGTNSRTQFFRLHQP